jgi:hypothetical protein
VQNDKEPELCFAQLDQRTEQTIRNMHTSIAMRQSNLLSADNGSKHKENHRNIQPNKTMRINLPKPEEALSHIRVCEPILNLMINHLAEY